VGAGGESGDEAAARGVGASGDGGGARGGARGRGRGTPPPPPQNESRKKESSGSADGLLSQIKMGTSLKKAVIEAKEEKQSDMKDSLLSSMLQRRSSVELDDGDENDDSGNSGGAWSDDDEGESIKEIIKEREEEREKKEERKILREEPKGKLKLIQEELEQTKSIMHSNIERLVNRSEKLDMLMEQTEQLSDSTVQFKQRASKLKPSFFSTLFSKTTSSFCSGAHS